MSLRPGLIALLLLPLAAVDAARGADRIEVETAWVNLREAVFEVNAQTRFPVDERVQAALEAGASIHFDLECVVEKKRRYWLNHKLVDATLTRELSWNGLTQRYVLQEADGGEQRSFATLEEALAAAGQVVNWPVMVEPELDPEATYRIRVRAGFRRGSPARLRRLIPWSDDWNRRSGWNAWILPR
jgi:hypothetical protein